MSEQVDHAKAQAKAQLSSIKEMIKALKDAEDNENESAREDAYQTIQDDPLSVEVRDGWHSPGAESSGAEEYMILLCTGGPACRIVGNLDKYSQPESARIEYQDWGTPWTEYRLTSEEEETVVAYAQCFYFGE